MSDAIVYVPPDLPNDLTHANHAWAYADRRGLYVASVFRRRGDVLKALAAGIASVVVFARRAHWDASWGGVPAEFADEETQRICYVARPDRKIREAARTLPRGDDGGFAERFLRARRAPRHMSDT